MVRARLASFTVVAGLGLAAGCLNMSNLPFMNRHRDSIMTDGPCCDMPGAMPTEGPMLGEVIPPYSGPPGVTVTPPPAPQSPVLPLGPVPQRLVPQPQAPTTPYDPRNPG
jgi:hypothetical protein